MVVFTPVDGRPDRAWIEERLGDWNTIHSVVPHGYESYVRVFHPVEARLLEWTGSSYETLEARTLRWSELAQLTGAVAHPLMQWAGIGGRPPRFQEESRSWQYGEPEQGRMPVELLARIAVILAGEGSTACRAGLWEGNGWLHPGSGTSVLLSYSADVEPGAEPPPRVDETIPFGPTEWEDRKLELPNRAYFVFEFDLARLTSSAWVEDSGWG